MSTYLYTGEGGGKTTNALGLALRCIGHKKKVVIVQFLKWWKNTGEYKLSKEEWIKDYYKIYQFGREGWHGFGNLTGEDKDLCGKALKFTEEISKKEKPYLLVLDEINLACYLKLLDVNGLIETLKRIKEENKEMTIVMTGRYAPEELINFSDYVNEVNVVKIGEYETREGIQY